MFLLLRRIIPSALLAVVLKCSGAPFGTNASARVTAIKPLPSAASFANSNNIPIQKMDALIDSDLARAGDSVTALVTLSEKGQVRQWMLYTRITAPPARTNGAMTIYNSFGSKFEFPSIPTAVSLRSAGPFIDAASKQRAPKIVDDTASFELDKGFLSLGLDQAAAAIIRLAPKKKTGAQLASGPVKFPETQIKRNRELAGEWRPTQEEERAFGGSYPALLSYFGVVQHTESLSDILAEVVDRPSLFSLAANLGIREIGFAWQGAYPSQIPASSWGLDAEVPIYEIPMVLELNKHPSLHITMIVTAPRPPLLTSAGILGVLAEKPGKPESFMVIRIIDARLGLAVAAAK